MPAQRKPVIPTTTPDVPRPVAVPPREHSGLTRKDVGEGIATRDLQGRVLGPKNIKEECGEAAQDAQEAEGGNDPQEQHRLGIHAEVCSGETRPSGPQAAPWSPHLGGVCPPQPQAWSAGES